MKLLYAIIASVALHLASLQAVEADNQNAGYEERPWKKLQNPVNDGNENIINTATSSTMASIHTQMYSQPEKTVGRMGRRANRKKRRKNKKSSKSSGKGSGVSSKNSGKGKGSGVLLCESGIIDIPSNKGKGKGGKKKKRKKKKNGSRRLQNESILNCAPSTQPSAAPTQSMSPSTNPADQEIDPDLPNDTTEFPSLKPSSLPSRTPSVSPSLSQSPSRTPSADPSSLPSSVPSIKPSSFPSCKGSCTDDPEKPYLTPKCDCVADPCNACPDGTVCIDDDPNDIYCLDCTCGACDLEGDSCCEA